MAPTVAPIPTPGPCFLHDTWNLTVGVVYSFLYHLHPHDVPRRQRFLIVFVPCKFQHPGVAWHRQKEVQLIDQELDSEFQTEDTCSQGLIPALGWAVVELGG